MAHLPDDYDVGDNRQLLADPNGAGLHDIVGDMAALSLQTLQLVRANAAGDAEVAAADRIAANIRRVLEASNTSQARERATRELQPITRLPPEDEPYGAHANIAAIRMNNVPLFSGTDKDTLDVVRWLSRILTLAQGNALSFEATVLLLIQGSSGGAADYIEQMRDEGKTLHQIVQQLEMRYGNLCTPEEARTKCNSMPRREGEGLSEFIDRLRQMARMACRLVVHDGDRRAAMDILVENNIRRGLPTSVRNALEERVVNRSRMGLPALTAREVEKECLDLERRREERRVKTSEPPRAKKHARLVHQAQQVYEPEVDSTDDSASSADEIDIEDEGTYHLICEIKQQEKKYAARGQAIDPRQIYRKAVRKYNERFPPSKFQRRPPPGNYGARQAGVVTPAGNGAQPAPGPPNNLDTKVRRTIAELLALANCTRGHCIQCGAEGHYMHNEACALRDKPLMDRPCVKCGTGLHSADCCPKVFQQQYTAPAKAQQPQVNNVINETLNDH